MLRQQWCQSLLLLEVVLGLGGEVVYGGWVIQAEDVQRGEQGGEVLASMVLQGVQVGGMGEHAARAAVLDHEGEPGAGVLGVQGQVGRTGLEHGEHADDERGAAIEQDGHDLLGADALLDEGVGERVGARVHLGVGQALGVAERILVKQRAGIGRTRHLCLEQGGQALGLIGQRDGRAVAARDQRVLLVGQQHGQRAQRGVGVLGCDGNEVRESLEQGSGALLIEAGRVVAQAQHHLLAGQDSERHGVVRAILDLDLLEIERAESFRGVLNGVVLKDEQGLEHGLARHAGERLDAHEPEVGVLVLLGLFGLLGAQPLHERLARGERQAQRQRVDEQAQRLVDAGQLTAAAIAHAADHDLIELA